MNEPADCTPTVRMALFAAAFCCALMAMLALTEDRAIGWLFVLSAVACLTCSIWIEAGGRK